MARYSVREGRWYGKRHADRPLPEMRCDEREFQTELGKGLMRVDIGTPIPRLPAEPQPVAVKEQPKAAAVPAPAPSFDLTPILPPDLRPRPSRPHVSAFTRD